MHNILSNNYCRWCVNTVCFNHRAPYIIIDPIRNIYIFSQFLLVLEGLRFNKKKYLNKLSLTKMGWTFTVHWYDRSLVEAIDYSSTKRSSDLIYPKSLNFVNMSSTNEKSTLELVPHCLIWIPLLNWNNNHYDDDCMVIITIMIMLLWIRTIQFWCIGKQNE